MTPQPTLHVPPKIAAGIAAGIFRRDGGVIRWADSGRIYAFLKDAVPTGEASEQAKGTVATVLKSRGALVAGAAIGTAAAGAAVLVHLKRRRASATEVPETVAALNTALRAYMDAARAGTLDAASIGDLITALDTVTEQEVSEGVPFDFSSDLWKSLVALIVDHTQKLAEAYGVDLSELHEDAPADNDATVIELRRHLEAQRQIFTDAA